MRILSNKCAGNSEQLELKYPEMGFWIYWWERPVEEGGEQFLGKIGPFPSYSSHAEKLNINGHSYMLMLIKFCYPYTNALS